MSTARPKRGERLQQIRQRNDLPLSMTTGSNNADGDSNNKKIRQPTIPNNRHSSSDDRKLHSTKFVEDEKPGPGIGSTPSIDPYIGKLERFELFCTNQSYYLIGSNRLNTAYRVLKMDRTLIERPESEQSEDMRQKLPRQVSRAETPPHSETNTTSQHGASVNMQQASSSGSSDYPATVEASHNAKPTLRPLSEFLTEDPNIYSQDEIHEMLDMIHDGNRLRRNDRVGGDEISQGGSGGLKPIAKAYGIVGFIRFLDCYYLTLITRRAKVGSIGGNGIYTIKGTETFPIKPAERIPGSAANVDMQADPSSVLLSMWNRGKRRVGLGLSNREIAELRYQGLYQVVDLTKNFYFSYTYDVTRSLQENFLSTTSQPFPPPPFQEMFAWNYFLTRELEACTHVFTRFYWLLPIIHGAFVQRKLNDYGRSLNIVLLARRSRHFAGTRYLKRGVSEQGKVANDVEHEQILHDESSHTSNGTFSSYMQVRGSIPTFWTQESSVTMPKPPIELNRVDPTYTATQLHFEDLMKRYGGPIVVLDLVKQSEKREREVRVGNEFRQGISYINSNIDDDGHKIRYCALDYSHISRHRNLDVSTSLNEVSTWAVNQTGFFCSDPKWKIVGGGSIQPFDKQKDLLCAKFGIPVFPMEQTGVLRTNCIDCLDRTNVAQFSAGVEAMEQQLVVMGIRSNAKLDPSSNIVRVLIDMYVDIGDHIALQYGGSEAHKKVTTEGPSVVGPIGKHKELLTSIRRYYSNAFTDRLKQDAMNLFLGYYIPHKHAVPLWEIESDYYLHNFHVSSGRGASHSMIRYQRSFGVADWDNNSEKDNAASRSIDQEDRLRRIARVRIRCNAQSKALSSWWKLAVQANVQRRMWINVGRNPIDSMLPPRFERIYQPGKIAQFDRFFSRSWATPVRRPPSSNQHADDPGSDKLLLEFRRDISGRVGDSSTTPESSFGTKKSFESLVDRDFVKSDPRLTSLLNGRSKVGARLRTTEEGGDSSENKFIPREFLDYIEGPSDASAASFRQESLNEFTDSLEPFSLNSKDVDGISRLARSAHLGQVIGTGPYRGLFQEESAIEVSTTVHEILNALESMRNRGNVAENDTSLLDAELRRRGLFTSGIKDTISAAWDSRLQSELSYSEIFEESGNESRRSDLTTEDNIKLYSSFYAPDRSLSEIERSSVFGMRSQERARRQSRYQSKVVSNDSVFVSKASGLGFEVSPHHADKSLPLFPFEKHQQVPAGFEMINEDMFARKDNKFMVFNRAGVHSWTGTEPKTKVTGIGSMLLGTLS